MTDTPILSSVPPVVDEIEYGTVVEALNRARAQYHSCRVLNRLQQTPGEKDGSTLLVDLQNAGFYEKNLHQTIGAKVTAAESQVRVLEQYLSELDGLIAARQALTEGLNV